MTAPHVVEVTQVRVEPPLVDRAPARTHRLGIFSRFTSALEWLSGRLKENGPDEDGGLVYYRLDEIVLDGALRIARTMVFGADDKSRGIIDGDGDKPWGGCPPEDCRHKLGDLVGFVSPYGSVYRVGIVLAQPPTPEAARRGRLTIADNVYLLGTLDADGRPETDEHAHLHRALVFPLGHELSQTFRERLRRRSERYRR
jgi:hypothetical protein